MAYADPLDQSDPSQAEKARLGAGRIRSLAAAVRQRLGSVFSDVDADPMVLRASTVGSLQITDGAVGTAELADLGITTAKLADASVSATKYVDASIEIAKLSAVARTTLTDRIVKDTYVLTALSPVLPANDKLVFSSANTGAAIIGKTLYAYWKATPAVDIASDAVIQGCTITPIANGNFIGVVVRNHTAGILNLNGYTIEVGVLVDP